MVLPVVYEVSISFTFWWLWIQFVYHLETAIFYIYGDEVILEHGNNVDYQETQQKKS